MRPRSVMIDLETKATSKRPVILSIGAVGFDDDGFLNSYDKARPTVFYAQLPWKDDSQAGRDVDPSTMEWWQNTAGRTALQILKHPSPQQAQWIYPGLKDALIALAEFIRAEKNEAGRVITKGIDFDLAILEQAYYEYKMELPWKYWHSRCLRAWFEALHLFGVSPAIATGMKGQHSGIAHHAADDAILQTKTYICYNHTAWKIMSKTAQRGFDFDAEPVQPRPPGPRKPYLTGAAAEATMQEAPELEAAP